jgi:3'-phosphoadenosine 5'-phosphosulfate sulfotransferase (PAPS reductase)/FAD synthetase
MSARDPGGAAFARAAAAFAGSPFAEAAAALARGPTSYREAPRSTRRLRHGTMPCGPPYPAHAFLPTPAEVDVDPFAYDRVIIAFSGGKDSLALLLLMLELGVPRERIELWHHLVDGAEGSTLMDWPCTDAYCSALADAFGVRIYRSWKIGGFEREMLKHKAPTAGYRFETPDGLQETGGESTNLGTREAYPQTSPDLRVRWCSAYCKIMVMEAALRNQERIHDSSSLVLVGECADESPKRAGYEVFERHKTDLRDGRSPKFGKPRLIDTWRPIHKWPRSERWRIIERYSVNPHPAYRLGWSRLSCAGCIFGDEDQWASLRTVNPRQLRGIAKHEASFKKTIDRKGRTVLQMADAGTPYEGMRQEDIRAAVSTTWDEPVFIHPWVLPKGAYGASCGPS